MVAVVVKSVNFSEDVLAIVRQRAGGNLSGFINEFLREHLLRRKKVSYLGSLKGTGLSLRGLKEKRDRLDDW